MPDWGKIALYGGVAIGAYFIARTVFAREDESSSTPSVSAGPPPPIGPWTDTDPPHPIYVGQRGDPELESLLQEMDDFFRSYGGINLNWVDAAEVTEMRKTNGYHAIPPREYWPRMAATLRYVFMPIRTAVGPVTLTSAYRPPDYNEAVGGTDGSRHQFFEALDMMAPDGMANVQAATGADIWNRYGDLLRMGYGVYGSEDYAANIHVDTGSDSRRWENAKYWTNQVAA